MKKRVIIPILCVLVLVLVLSGCAGGNMRYLEKPAGFWAGLWHGFICLVTFVISLFTDSVYMYETNNVGLWYDFGFLLGVMCAFGAGNKGGKAKKKKAKSKEEIEWEEIGSRVEEKVRRGIQNWLDESDSEERDWETIGKQVEDKIKRELKKWADK